MRTQNMQFTDNQNLHYDSIYQDIYYKYMEDHCMMNAKLFENGRSQAVRLPKECRFEGNEVSVSKIGDIVILIPKNKKWAGFMESLELFSDDFMNEGRKQSTVDDREKL